MCHLNLFIFHCVECEFDVSNTHSHTIYSIDLCVNISLVELTITSIV
jgi:hypothetical protein